MMKKWRPFWSYRVEETENWLCEMAAQGYHFKRLTYFSSFEFEKDTPKKQTYLLDIHSDAGRLLRAGWKRASELGNWTVYEMETAQLFPSREKVFKRLRTHFYILMMLIVLFIPIILMPMILMINIGSDSFLSSFTFTFFLAYGILFAIIGFLYMKFRGKEKQYLGITKSTHKIKAMKKMRSGWFYMPYDTKKWLNEMFEQGFELEKAGNVFFYFVPKKSERISYEISYEKALNDSYFQLHQEMGWELKFTTSTTFMNTTIWAMPYEAGEEKPMLTYEKQEKMQAIKRAFRFSTIISICIILCLGMNVVLMLSTHGFSLFNQFSIYTFNFLLGSFVVIMWLFIWGRSLHGYLAEKKQLMLDEVME